MKATIRYGTCIYSKPGRLVGLADCYAVIVIADNATFLLAVNRIAAFRRHSAVILHIIIRCRGTVGRASAHRSRGRGFESHQEQHFSTCLCPSRHTRSERNYPASVSAERATPKPHSLTVFSYCKFLDYMVLQCMLYMYVIINHSPFTLTKYPHIFSPYWVLKRYSPKGSSTLSLGLIFTSALPPDCGA